ncbi:histidinol dehydrogenase [Parageobacillus thermoglucosidasius]|uniref:histidinol dehydrogenase n=1 Tax=Parageobacillus thermoglucosidasius TaxID=1426 RepID=UPI000E18FC9D|nr:histidinol dehydrogenase [Parageobacillus thermoglucosidasius]MED4905450.1 histidinol dehydrogenase [Parageobacillus thermoglucosidasius]MED4913849.1 histidinol dehydrogenase [Parageobacillus thermoglucosidasius]MED4943828.1 histidinol dehydrogenase [Parageobacillus thermoglucosidasius]MED4983654.1 histidinol dehydrogenase [Parageobacillus thermoglucosidasius]RDE29588.1 histidinol dehydrogenase [Parageobacillus thermoglucosidasius]
MKIERVKSRVSLRRTIESGTEEQRRAVLEIIATVRARGDEALKSYTEKFDGVRLDSLRVTNEEIEAAYQNVSEEALRIIREAAENIRDYHERQKRESWIIAKEDGTMLGQKITPLDAVGLYVPGGTAAYPSSVLMNVIPAQVAGVKRIVITSPPNKNGTLPAGVLVAASELGVKEIYKVGGAQAIAALAYGTETIRPVDKIFGPGNIYVALAKREVFGQVAIDMIAGPSEIVVLADETANVNEIAADLLSQAEHDERASAILVTPSMKLALAVASEVKKQLETLPRKAIAVSALENYGAIYVTETLAEAVEVVNELAPEHLEVMTAEPMQLLGQIRHAGAIFLGRFSSEPVGDYFAGPNHVLPTNGTARFSSGLSVDEFVKKSSIIFYSEPALQRNAGKIAAFARLEGLEAHARAVEERFKK